MYLTDAYTPTPHRSGCDRRQPTSPAYCMTCHEPESPFDAVLVEDVRLKGGRVLPAGGLLLIREEREMPNLRKGGTMQMVTFDLDGYRLAISAKHVQRVGQVH